MRLVNLGVASIKWASFSNILKQILQFIVILILPLFLAPSDFGLMAMANVVIAFNNIFKNLGFSSALIQKKDVSKELFSTLFFANLFIGLILFLIIFFFSPFISTILTNNLNERKELSKILKVISIGLFLSSPSLIQLAILEKNLLFDKIAKIEISSSFFSAITGILLAVNGYGVWSLVFQNLVLIIVSGILFWISCPQKPSFIFKISEIKSVFSFSINLTGFQIINYIYRNLDKILIGKFLGSTDLGYYSLAYRIMVYPLQNITRIISRVMFPLYSKIQNENKKIRNGFKLVSNSIALITFPLMFAISVLSKEMVSIFWGQNWITVAILISLLSPVAAIQSVTTTTGSIFQAKGRTDKMFKWGIVMGITFTISYFIGINFGVVGVAAFYLLANLLLLYPWLKIPLRLINLSVSELIFSLRGVILSTIIMIIIELLFKFLLKGSLDLPSLFVFSIFVAGLTYILSSFIFNKEYIQTFWNILFQSNAEKK